MHADVVGCSHGDMEWKTTDHLEPAEYWASPSDRRNVNSVESWYSVNNWYCLYSRMTGKRICDQVCLRVCVCVCVCVPAWLFLSVVVRGDPQPADQ